MPREGGKEKLVKSKVMLLEAKSHSEQVIDRLELWQWGQQASLQKQLWGRVQGGAAGNKGQPDARRDAHSQSKTKWHMLRKRKGTREALCERSPRKKVGYVNAWLVGPEQSHSEVKFVQAKKAFETQMQRHTRRWTMLGSGCLCRITKHVP